MKHCSVYQWPLQMKKEQWVPGLVLQIFDNFRFYAQLSQIRRCRNLRALSGKFLREKSCCPESFCFLWLCIGLGLDVHWDFFFIIFFGNVTSALDWMFIQKFVQMEQKGFWLHPRSTLFNFQMKMISFKFVKKIKYLRRRNNERIEF